VKDESDRKAQLVKAIQLLVEQRGAPDHFDASTWVSEWISQPLTWVIGIHILA
jgi:spore germination cell wall hydrolase CwlJ-like protein